MRTLALLFVVLAANAADFRLGIVGTDTSHVIAFTEILNNPSAPGHVPGARIVAAYKGGTDLEVSRTRVDKFASELQTKWNIELVPDIPTLCSKVDGILLESVDGRIHLAQARQVIAAHKPLFIDKPLADTLEDAREIARLAKAAGVPWFSASSLRFGEAAAALKSPDNLGATTWGPGPLEQRYHLDLAWYAIHPIELLYTLMGPGCEEVTRTSGADGDVIVGRWRGGRLGSVRPLSSGGRYGAVVFRAEAILQSDPKAKDAYGELVREVVRFFQTGVSPVPHEETLEIFAFMDAAQRSKAAGGAPMKLR